jgi:sortase A
MIALCGIIYGWSLHARDAGIRAMERARERNFTASALAHPAPDLSSAAPDTTSWAPKRISAYEAALSSNDMPAAVLRIPALHLSVPVFDGTTEWALNRGAGRVAGTAAFESAGNLGIAGHRDGFFRPLRNIRIGDLLYLDTTTSTIRYRVTQTRIVAPTAVYVLHATPNRTVTLITCYPFYYIGPAPQRFIVHAAQIDSEAPH